MGEHGPLPEQALKDRLRFPAQEPPELTAQRLSLFRWPRVTKRNAGVPKMHSIVAGGDVRKVQGNP